MKKASMVIIIVSLLFLSPLVSTKAQGELASQEVDIEILGENGLSLNIQSAEFRMGIDELTDSINDEEFYLVLYGELINSSNNQECVRARRVRLILDEREYAPQDYVMSAIQADDNPSIDFIGPVLGQCVEANSQSQTFVAFTVPLEIENIQLSFWGNVEQLDILWPQSIDDIDTLKNSDENNIDEESEMVIWGSAKSNNTNIRDCASTTCSVVSVISQSDEIRILDMSEEWYLVELDNGDTGYIRGDLINITPQVNVNEVSVTSEIPLLGTDETFNENTILLLIELTVVSQGLEMQSIEMDDGILTINAPANSINYPTKGEYQIYFVGVVTAIIAAGYELEEADAIPPEEIVINFMNNSLTDIMVTIQYDNALDFMKERITAEEFFITWQVQ